MNAIIWPGRLGTSIKVERALVEREKRVACLLVHVADYPPLKGSAMDFWSAWKHSFFCRKLPLQSVLKIVDVYMGEGHKAILRVALALLELHAPALAKGTEAGHACT